MSSHHFVKDKQEPALLILGKTEMDEESIGQLLEWSPSIWISENSLEEALRLGIHIDGIFYTNPLQKEYINEQLAAFLTLEYVLIEKENLLSSILNYLIDTNHKAVNIVGLKNLSSVLLFEKSKAIDIIIYDVGHKSYICTKPVFTKWMSKGSRLKICGDKKIPVASLLNMQQETENTFGVIEDGIVEIIFEQGPVLISEEL